MKMSQDSEDTQTKNQNTESRDSAQEKSGSSIEDLAEIVTDSSQNIELEGEQAMISVSQAWSAMSPNERKERFAQLARTEAEDLFLSLKAMDQAELIAEISPLEKRSWVRMLPPDDVADLIQNLGLDRKEEILDLLDPQTRREVTALLAYSEDAAGGLMSSRFVRLRPDMSVDEAISYLRIQSKTHVETIYYAYVIDSDQTLMGVVSFREMFSQAPHKKIRDIMKSDLVKIPVGLDQEQVAKIFNQADLMALPVVDEWDHIKGIVTFDDIANVVQEEATEDIQKLGAVEVLDAPYMNTGFFELMKKRAGWLTVLFVSEMFTASAMSYFEHEIQKAVVLALFIPLIISSGGNSGSQACTLIIRSLALGEIRNRDWIRVLGREILMGLTLGTILGIIGLIRVVLWPTRDELYGPHYMLIGAAVAASVLGVVMWGTITGSMLPFILKKLKLDPATASAPFVATIVDVTGLVIYFTAASLLLTGTLL
ncbi:MAG: magnesium transporter MgtE [Oligoflexia bacterium]|nr:MAG: magnesium transporter MgtE [Oligoflexia bacterium]